MFSFTHKNHFLIVFTRITRRTSNIELLLKSFYFFYNSHFFPRRFFRFLHQFFSCIFFTKGNNKVLLNIRWWFCAIEENHKVAINLNVSAHPICIIWFANIHRKSTLTSLRVFQQLFFDVYPNTLQSKLKFIVISFDEISFQTRNTILITISLNTHRHRQHTTIRIRNALLIFSFLNFPLH